MIPADDLPPTLPQDELDRVNAGLADEAEAVRLADLDWPPLTGGEEVSGVILGPKGELKVYDPDDDWYGPNVVTVVPRRECRVEYLPGEGPT